MAGDQNCCYHHQGEKDDQIEAKLYAFKKLNIQCIRGKQGESDDDDDDDCQLKCGVQTTCAMHIMYGMIRSCR